MTIWSGDVRIADADPPGRLRIADKLKPHLWRSLVGTQGIEENCRGDAPSPKIAATVGTPATIKMRIALRPSL
jgi:hypothetical protein